MISYKLEKISTNNEKTLVRVGHKSVGRLFVAILNDDGILKHASLDDVNVNCQVFIYSLFDYLRCSPISKIISRTDNKVTFETTTSIYELSKISVDNE